MPAKWRCHGSPTDGAKHHATNVRQSNAKWFQIRRELTQRSASAVVLAVDLAVDLAFDLKCPFKPRWPEFDIDSAGRP